MTYEFRRPIYQDVVKSLSKTNASFLLGPRKCGKTVCLRQIEESHKNSEYINFKLLKTDESQDVFEKIRNSIRNNEPVIYLLDEITYASLPEKEICSIADVLTEVEHTNTKIVFTGSQSVALEAWERRAFCGTASVIKADFLNYAEWLQYKKIEEVSEQTYQRFLNEVSEFYGVHSLEEYLTGCLEETVISNAKTSNYIYGNDCHLVDVETLIDICYATLFTLHNHVNNQTFSKQDKLTENIAYYFRNACKDLENGELQQRIANSFIGSYNSFRTKDLDTLKQSFLFLKQCGLITITPVTDTIERVPNIYKDLKAEESRINYKEDLFRTYNVCIKYPMFYVRILQDILKEQMPEQLPKALLGSIVECHIRGLLPDANCIEYHDENDNEIDYVNIKEQFSVEMTVTNKTNRETHFEQLPREYGNVLLTKDISSDAKNIFQLPYYDFIHLCSCVTDKSLILTEVKKNIQKKQNFLLENPSNVSEEVNAWQCRGKSR